MSSFKQYLAEADSPLETLKRDLDEFKIGNSGWICKETAIDKQLDAVTFTTKKGDDGSIAFEPKTKQYQLIIAGYKRDIEAGEYDDLKELVDFLKRGLTKAWYRDNDPDGDRW